MATSQAEGRREDALIKERAKMREEFERQKQKLISETEKARPSNARFIGQNDSMEDTLKKTTVGLVRLEDFQQKRKEIEEAKAREAAKSDELKYVFILLIFLARWLIGHGGTFREEQRKIKKRKKAVKATLSFAVEEDEDGGNESNGNGDSDVSAKKRLRKNPNVDTSFLPDREREESERKEREELRKEWLHRQEELKNEDIEITYSYWDGSGHRKSVTVSKDFAPPLRA